MKILQYQAVYGIIKTHKNCYLVVSRILTWEMKNLGKNLGNILRNPIK